MAAFKHLVTIMERLRAENMAVLEETWPTVSTGQEATEAIQEKMKACQQVMKTCLEKVEATIMA
jgi:hypothetical protein